MILLVQLFLAHIIGDFFLQSNAWVNNKEQKKWRSIYLYLHAFIHFILIIIVVNSITFWKTAAMIAVSHFIIDLAKLSLQKPGTKRSWFFIDQSLHIIVLVMAWGYLNGSGLNLSFLSNERILITGTAILVLLQPASLLIKNIISKWTPENHFQEEHDSLQNAGKVIGYLERLLIFCFIMIQNWEAIGFLLAAKSIFRFGDLKESKDRKLTEYVLIGTLLSFGITILTGVITLRLLVST